MTTAKVYQTPDSWGNETEYAEYEQMLEMVESLKELGDDWANISIDDCKEFDLAVSNKTGYVFYRSRDGEEVELQKAYKPGVYKERGR